MRNISLLYDGILDFGGVESHLACLLRNSDSNYYRFTIITPGIARFASRIQSLGAEEISFDSWFPFNPANIINLARILKRSQSDLVHAHSPTAAAIGRLAAKLAGVPAIVTVHLPVKIYHGSLQSVRSRLGRWMFVALDTFLNYSFTERLIFVSQKAKDHEIVSKRAPKDHSEVIPNGVNVDNSYKQKKVVRSAMGLEEHEQVIVFTGRLDAQKGVDRLLLAMGKLCDDFRHIWLWVVGDGSLRPAFEEMASNLEIEDRVIFWGYQSDVRNLLDAADIFILPSHYEAMPYSLLEALAAGLPCVITDVGDNDLTIEDGVQGFVIPPGDTTALVAAIGRILADRDLQQRMSAASRLRADLFSVNTMAKRVQRVYARILKNT